MSKLIFINSSIVSSEYDLLGTVHQCFYSYARRVLRPDIDLLEPELNQDNI